MDEVKRVLKSPEPEPEPVPELSPLVFKSEGYDLSPVIEAYAQPTPALFVLSTPQGTCYHLWTPSRWEYELNEDDPDVVSGNYVSEWTCSFCLEKKK